ncbi:MAG: glycosyltransferase family 2 protein [Sodaliphilus sp.]|nr:glycosyltransferase family 2 protein [Sodaliphilus sp.]
MKVTVVTAVLNDAGHIEQTILSVISQTNIEIEYIIVDGGSKDGTLELIGKYKDKISLLISEPDRGVYDAMNKGIKYSTGDFVYFLNSGDVLLNPSILSKIKLEELKERNAIIYGNVVVAYGNIEALEKPRPFFNSKMKFKGIGICHQSMFFPGELIRNEKYDLSYNIAADYDLAYRLWRKGTVFLYKDITIAKYDWGKGISSNPYKLLDVYRENARVCHQQLNPLYWAKMVLEYIRLQKKLANLKNS